MKYTIEEQASIDIDWFAVDCNGLIIHFASGGGQLPLSVSDNKNDTDKLSKYFRSLPALKAPIHVSGNLSDTITFSSEEEQNRYLSDFMTMAKKGLYSFDKNKPGNFENKEYHLVTFPKNSLNIKELPKDIKTILSRTSLTESIENIYSISIKNTQLVVGSV